MDVKSGIRSFFSKASNVITVIIAILVAVIYLLLGKNNNLKALLGLAGSNEKDAVLSEQLKVKQLESKAEADKEALLKKQLKEKVEAAEKADPEDFWKKH